MIQNLIKLNPRRIYKTDSSVNIYFDENVKVELRTSYNVSSILSQHEISLHIKVQDFSNDAVILEQTLVTKEVIQEMIGIYNIWECTVEAKIASDQAKARFDFERITNLYE